MSQIKSKERVAERGEVFTAEREVNAMLDLVENECLRPDSRFLEPACGDGNFLSAILKRKLAELRRKYKKSPRDYEKLAIVAIGSLYGVDIMNDNVGLPNLLGSALRSRLPKRYRSGRGARWPNSLETSPGPLRVKGAAAPWCLNSLLLVSSSP